MFNDGISRISAGCAHADLDQFMVIERGFILGKQRLAQARIADNDERFLMVAKAAQVFLL